MALKAKHPHIRIDEMIWDDPVMLDISTLAFRSYIFAIAWSKSQNGRTRDGLLTPHGIRMIAGTLDVVQELVNHRLLEKCEGGYEILKYTEWQMTHEEDVEQKRVEAERAAQQQEYGRQGAAKRIAREKARSTPVEDGFDVDAAFEAAWAEWPDAVDPRWREKREDAYDSFRVNVTNRKDFESFEAALMKRIKAYHSESIPKAERRKFLGAFKNFCDGRWKDWLPKSRREQPAPPPAALVEEPVQPAKNPYAISDEELLQYLEPKPAA